MINLNINSNLPLIGDDLLSLDVLDPTIKNKIIAAINTAPAGSKIYLTINDIITSAIIHTPTNQVISVL
jgi:hypothetical protein